MERLFVLSNLVSARLGADTEFRTRVSFAVQVENRYKGIRSPHKMKSAVSGCVRECAKAQGKDFGMIATENGYNLFVGGNGGVNPVHANFLLRILTRTLCLSTLTATLCTTFSLRTDWSTQHHGKRSSQAERMEGGLSNT